MPLIWTSCDARGSAVRRRKQRAALIIRGRTLRIGTDPRTRRVGPMRPATRLSGSTLIDYSLAREQHSGQRIARVKGCCRVADCIGPNNCSCMVSTVPVFYVIVACLIILAVVVKAEVEVYGGEWLAHIQYCRPTPRNTETTHQLGYVLAVSCSSGWIQSLVCHIH